MGKAGRMTRNCIEPWRSMQFEAGGTIGPCCGGTLKGDFGNIVTDYFEAVEQGKPVNIFANARYRALRKSLLTGNLLSECISCRSVHDEDITTEELGIRVSNHLKSNGIEPVGADLTREYAFTECGGNITNNCNFSCVYCSHSGENGHTGHYRKEMERERFLRLLNFLVGRGLKIFNFCGIGELTTYSGWTELCHELLARHPRLRLRAISNFGGKLSEAELDTLARMDLVHVSCDTLDETLYAWLRKGGRLPVLLDNIKRLKARLGGNPAGDTKIALNVTATNLVVDKLETLFRFASDHGLVVHMSNLFEMDGSIASNTRCVTRISDMDDARIPAIRETLTDLPRRLKAQNPFTNVWEYKFLYKAIDAKADSITLNKFVPGCEETIYSSFYEAHPRNPEAHLGKIWLSFDSCYRGIFIDAGKTVRVPVAAPGTLSYRAIWRRDRLDGNLEVVEGPVEQGKISGELEIDATNCGRGFTKMLLEVLSHVRENVDGMPMGVISPHPPEITTAPVVVREAFLVNEEESIARNLAESGEPVVIWCAGLKTLQMLSNTSLGKANIKMIIDGDPARKGEIFCGYPLSSPADLGDFQGKIIVMHASSPERVEFQIRQMGISNEIIII